MRNHNRARLNPRHSRFVGTYVAMNMKSISDNNQICHKPAKSIVEVLDDSAKKMTRKPKNKIALEVCLNFYFFLKILFN